MIEVEDVSKAFGPVQALASVSMHAQAGRVLGLLGPNGAGKTTLVRIVTTLLRPDSGHSRVAGLDIVRDAVALRSAIGLAGQYAAVDEMPTERENLELVGQLYQSGPGRAAAAGRAGARAVPAGRRRRPAGADLLRRHAAEAGPGRRRWETRVYHWRAAEKAHGHHLYRWIQRGGHLGLRRKGGRGHLWLRLGDEGRGFAAEFFKPLR